MLASIALLLAACGQPTHPFRRRFELNEGSSRRDPSAARVTPITQSGDNAPIHECTGSSLPERAIKEHSGTLAHRGGLFLDELGEFPTQLLDALRTPLEDGVVVVARKAATVEFPCRAQVVAATNPCPCGFEGDRQKPCVCGEAAIARYRRRFSGPLLDRLDVQIRLPRLRMSELTGPEGESSMVVRERVAAARGRQREERGRLNCDLGRTQLDALDWTTGAERTLRQAAELDHS